MARYKITTRVQTITQNTRLNEKEYGAWMCVNTGTATAKVMGIELQPSEGLDFLHSLQPGDLWDSPIDVELNAGAEIRIVRLKYIPL